MRAAAPGASKAPPACKAAKSTSPSSSSRHLLRRRQRDSVVSPIASLSSLLTVGSDWRCRGVDPSTSGSKLAGSEVSAPRHRRRKTLSSSSPSISTSTSTSRAASVATAAAASPSSSSSSSERQQPQPAGPYSSFNPAATRGPRISRIDVPFAVICLADELYARMAESDVSSPEGAAAAAISARPGPDMCGASHSAGSCGGGGNRGRPAAAAAKP